MFDIGSLLLLSGLLEYEISSSWKWVLGEKDDIIFYFKTTKVNILKQLKLTIRKHITL